MFKVTCLWFILPFLCCAFGQKYVVQKDIDYEAHTKEENNHYESNHYEHEHKAYPYRFGYDIKDEKGNNQYHKEEGDEHNVKKGSYGYTDAYGIYRQVDYIADHLGFRAKIRTNEPGTANFHPAHVTIYAEPPPSHIYANQEKYNHGTAYQQPEHGSYQEPEHTSYKQEEEISYQQPEHAPYQQQEHAPYQPTEHGSYQQPEYPVQEKQYEKPAHVSYEEPNHKDLIKSEQSSPTKHLKYKHRKTYPRIQQQKITYVPVYVANNIDYKH